MKMTIVRGCPGSGKSSWARKHRECCILENDQMQIRDGKYEWSAEGTKKAINLVYSLAKIILSSNCDVCICNTFTKKRFIECYRQLAEHYGAEFEVIRMTGEFKNTHNVPSYILDNMKKSFEDWPGEIIQDPDGEM